MGWGPCGQRRDTAGDASTFFGQPGDGILERRIAKVIGVEPKTLRRHYRSELDLGQLKANSAEAAEPIHEGHRRRPAIDHRRGNSKPPPGDGEYRWQRGLLLVRSHWNVEFYGAMDTIDNHRDRYGQEGLGSDVTNSIYLHPAGARRTSEDR